MLYSGEFRQIFRGMLLNIPGNVLKHSGECHKAFRGTSPNIPGNVTKYSGECHKTFWRMSSKIPGNVAKHSVECPIYFDGRELVEASSITVIFSGEWLIVCFVIFSVARNLRLGLVLSWVCLLVVVGMLMVHFL